MASLRVKGQKNELSSVQKFLLEQTADSYSQAATQSSEKPRSDHCVAQLELLVRRYAVDGSIGTVTLWSLENRLLYLSHHSSISGHPGQRRMYASV